MAIRGGQVSKIGPGMSMGKSPSLAGKGQVLKVGADPTYDKMPKLLAQSGKRVELKQLRSEASPSRRPTPLIVKR